MLVWDGWSSRACEDIFKSMTLTSVILFWLRLCFVTQWWEHTYIFKLKYFWGTWPLRKSMSRENIKQKITAMKNDHSIIKSKLPIALYAHSELRRVLYIGLRFAMLVRRRTHFQNRTQVCSWFGYICERWTTKLRTIFFILHSCTTDEKKAICDSYVHYIGTYAIHTPVS